MGTQGTVPTWQSESAFPALEPHTGASAKAHASGFLIDIEDTASCEGGLDNVAERGNAFDRLAKERP